MAPSSLKRYKQVANRRYATFEWYLFHSTLGKLGVGCAAIMVKAFKASKMRVFLSESLSTCFGKAAFSAFSA